MTGASWISNPPWSIRYPLITSSSHFGQLTDQGGR
jgi:hypothetical protein